MVLQTIQQFPGIIPNVSQGIRKGLEVRALSADLRNRERLSALEEQQRKTRQRAIGVSRKSPGSDTQMQALKRAIADNPKIAKDLLESVGIDDQIKAEQAARFAVTALQIPTLEGQNDLIIARARKLAKEGRSPDQTLSLLNMNPSERKDALIGLSEIALTSLERETFKLEREKIRGREAVSRRAASKRAFEPKLGKDEQGNTVFLSQVFDPATGQTRQEIIPLPEGVKIVRETPEEQREKGIVAATKAETAKLQARSDEEVSKEIRERVRISARAEVKSNKALKLAEIATQGFSGKVKLLSSRLFPNIDASDEGALDAAFKELALDTLQGFKGPTTDFEFGVAQSAAGALGGSKQANIARIKAIKRAQWFVKRELSQFNKFRGPKREFIFNFNEKIKTKKGEFRLQDIQDTAVENNLTIEETLKRLNE